MTHPLLLLCSGTLYALACLSITGLVALALYALTTEED
jgi:hypothetical protein